MGGWALEGTGWPDGQKKPSKRRRRIRNHRYRFWLKTPYCHYCKRPLQLEEATLDHVIPSSRGGSNDDDNLVVACYDCNHDKDDELPDGIDPEKYPRRGHKHRRRKREPKDAFWRMQAERATMRKQENHTDGGQAATQDSLEYRDPQEAD